jgi:hypothetical protein
VFQHHRPGPVHEVLQPLQCLRFAGSAYNILFSGGVGDLSGSWGGLRLRLGDLLKPQNRNATL